jgi:hypothetical protein
MQFLTAPAVGTAFSILQEFSSCCGPDWFTSSAIPQASGGQRADGDHCHSGLLYAWGDMSRASNSPPNSRPPSVGTGTHEVSLRPAVTKNDPTTTP